MYKNTLVRFAAREAGVEALEDHAHRSDGDRVRAAVMPPPRPRRCATTPGPTRPRGQGRRCWAPRSLSATDVEALADCPPERSLLAQLAGAFQAPLVKMAGLLAALPRNFAYGLKALIDRTRAASRRPPPPNPPPAQLQETPPWQ